VPLTASSGSLRPLASYAEAMAAAVGKDGVPGARVMFKEITREIRTAAAEAMLQLATSKPVETPADSR
jgi:hypothetical protein